MPLIHRLGQRINDRLLSIPQSGLLWTAVGSVIAVFLTTAVLVTVTVTVPLGSATDRPTWIGNEIVGGTFALAVIAAVVAIAAYAVSLRRPVLEPEIKFRYCDWNNPALGPLPTGPVGRRALILQLRRGNQMVNTRQGEAQLRVHNWSRWSARNPALRVEFSDMGFLRDSTGWRVDMQDSTRGTYSIIWEGGADRPIHGQWTVNLPDLNFAEVEILGSKPTIALDVVAEGFHCVKRLPVTLLTQEELEERMTTYGDQR